MRTVARNLDEKSVRGDPAARERTQRGARAECTYALDISQNARGNQFRGSGIEDGREKLVLPRFARGERRENARRGDERCSKSRRRAGEGQKGASNHPRTRRYETTVPSPMYGAATFVR